MYVHIHTFFVCYIYMCEMKFISMGLFTDFPHPCTGPSEPSNSVIVQFSILSSVSHFRPVLPDMFLCFCDADAGPGLRQEEGGQAEAPLQRFRQFTW